MTLNGIASHPYGASAGKVFLQNFYIWKLKYKIINFHDVARENTIAHNLNWSYIPDHPYRMLITEGSWSEKKWIT